MTMSPFPKSHYRGRVLLLEDASVFREMQSLLLRRAGYTVTSCEDPQMALLEASRQPYEIAVLNSDAPTAAPAEFVLALRRHQPSITIIFIAPVLTVELAAALKERGITMVLQRPVEPTLLIEKIDEALGSPIRPGPSRQIATDLDASTASPEAAKAILFNSLPSGKPVLVSPPSAPTFSSDSTVPFWTAPRIQSTSSLQPQAPAIGSIIRR